jgi:non-heme chloroperoxidase
MKRITQLNKKIFFAISLMLGYYFSSAEPNNKLRYIKDSAEVPASIKEQSIRLSTGVELQYAERGDKQETTIIFLHGYTDSWHSFEKVLNLFPKDFHLVALTQRGHGNSSKPQTGYHPKDFAADVAAFIAAKNLGRCIVVGHSMGGLVAQQFAINYHHLLKALIIIDSDASFADNPGFPEFADEVTKLKDPIEHSYAEAFQKSTVSKPVDSLMMNLWINESMKVPLYVWKEAMNGIMSVNYTTQLKSIGVPVLIFWGSNDSICFKAGQEGFIQNLKNAKLIVYDGTGHALHWEQPERFAADATTFVNSLKK